MQAQSRTRISPRSGRVRKRAARPRMSLTDRLVNLHQLLGSSSFERWPLKVTFYSEDVFKVWEKSTVVRLSRDLHVNLDESSKASHVGGNGVKGIHALDVGYSSLQDHLEKSQRLLAVETVKCSICSKRLRESESKCLVCPKDGCSTIGHLECFATAFSGQNADKILPVQGSCPGCGTTHKWVDLVREMSLRLRGEAEIKKIFKVKKPRVPKKAAQAAANEKVSDADDSEQEDDALPTEDDWPYISDVEEDILGRNKHMFRSEPAALQSRAQAFSISAPYSEPVIEDSEWDDAEVLA